MTPPTLPTEAQLLTRMLAAPLHPDRLRWKVVAAGLSDRRVWARILPYAPADALRERLDATVGIGGWTSALEVITTGPEPGVKCRLAVSFAGQWVHREDVAPFTEVDPLKGAASNAFKRAAAALGVAAYVRHLEPIAAEIVKDGRYAGVLRQADGSERPFRWNLPHDAWTRLLTDYLRVGDEVKAMRERLPAPSAPVLEAVA